MKQRITSSILMIALLVVAIEFVPLLFHLLILLTLIFASKEWGGISGLKQYQSLFYLSLVLALSIYFIDVEQWLQHQLIGVHKQFDYWLFAALLVQFLIIAYLWFNHFRQRKPCATQQRSYLNLAIGLLLLPASIISIGLIQNIGHTHVWFAIIIIASCDVGCYFGGRLFGKYKLMPLVSPNKTLEGVAGGVVLSLLVAMLFKWTMLPSIEWIELVAIVLILVFFTVMGDLWESNMKRQLDIKDSGKLLAGHGGILDRIDGFIFALPVYYFYVAGYL